MLRRRPPRAATLLVLLCACSAPPTTGELPPEAALTTWTMSYPEARLGEVVDDYHGTAVPDPYRWLEEPDSPETRAWVEAQNALSGPFLESLPQRAEIRARLEELLDHERYSLPRQRGGRWFFTKNDGLQEQAPLYVAETIDGEGRLLLDPNDFSADGSVSLADWCPSPDGKLLAYATSDGGSDWRHWRFLEIESGEHLPDEITRNKFGVLDWMDGGAGVVYSRFEVPTEGDELHARNAVNEVCLHLLGTPVEEDVVLREASPEGHWQWPALTQSRRAVVITERDTESDKDQVHVISLVGTSRGRGVELLTGFDARYDFVGNDGDRLWFVTDLEAPNRRLIEVDLLVPQGRRELVPEADATLEGAEAVGGHLVLSYLRDAHSEVRVHALDGELVRVLELPGLGSAAGFDGRLAEATTAFAFTGFTTPGEIWALDVASGETRLLRRPDVGLDPADYEVYQEWFESRDGPRGPMFLVHPRGGGGVGGAPALLYGYGGFDISLTPVYSPSWRMWIERGGLLAVANLRGGGEYGENWHKAGTKLQKQNVFDDFVAAAEHLIAEGYTSPEHLAIQGGSNGGLLVGACMIQRPDLFRVALPAVGVMDMLRYQHFTIGWAWERDYGSSEDPEEFAALHAYSPLHTLRDGVRYPATLVTTGDHDDRVVPAHSYKFAARLQAAGASGPENPYLIRIETRAGHGMGKATSVMLDEMADVLAFAEHFCRLGGARP